MKTKAFAVALLFLMALSLFMIPSIADIPPTPPAGEPRAPGFLVLPEKTKFWAPCSVSSEFEIEVAIWTDPLDDGLTNASKVYAFDFELVWDSTLITLTKIEVKPPYDEYFIIKNETGVVTKSFNFTHANLPDPGWVILTGTWDYYQLAITALDTTEPLWGQNVTAVVNLWFHVDDEPCWPDEWFSPFHLQDTLMSGPCGDPIDHWTEDAIYEINSRKPDMKVVNPNPFNATHPEWFLEWTNCTTFTVEIWVSNVAKMYDFEFYLYFNSTLKNTTIQDIHIKDLLPPPYEVQIIKVVHAKDPWHCLDYVYVKVVRPSEKPGISCADGPIVNIDFHTLCPTDEEGNYVLPYWTVSDFTLVGKISSKCPEVRYYRPVWFEAENINATLYTPFWTTGEYYSPPDSVNMTIPDIGASTYDEGVKMIIPNMCFDVWQLDDIDSTAMSFMAKLDATTALGLDTSVSPWTISSPYLSVIIDTGVVDLSHATPSDPHGSLVAFHATGLSTDTDHWGPVMNIQCISPGTSWPGWVDVTPRNPNAWIGWMYDGTDVGDLLTIGHQMDKSLLDWHNELMSAGYTGYSVVEFKVQYGFRPSSPAGTIFVDDVVIQGQTIYRVNLFDGKNFWRPKVHDLNQDGHVDEKDLSAIAKAYGETGPFDINVDGIIDIFDIVLVAKQFCKPYTPPLPKEDC